MSTRIPREVLTVLATLEAVSTGMSVGTAAGASRGGVGGIKVAITRIGRGVGSGLLVGGIVVVRRIGVGVTTMGGMGLGVDIAHLGRVALGMGVTR